MPELIVKTGPLAGHLIEVRSEIVLGREGGDVVVDDPKMSRRHAKVRPAGEGLEIEDLGSTNGTFLNGARIRGTRRLNAGDMVKMGETIIEMKAPLRKVGETRLAAAQSPAVPPFPAPPAATVSPQPAHSTGPPDSPTPAFAPPSQGSGRRSVATRTLAPTLVPIAVVVLTAVALILYFALRS